jgi:hypothetical protein
MHIKTEKATSYKKSLFESFKKNTEYLKKRKTRHRNQMPDPKD